VISKISNNLILTVVKELTCQEYLEPPGEAVTKVSARIPEGDQGELGTGMELSRTRGRIGRHRESEALVCVRQ
jgi:hypothetical protein